MNQCKITTMRTLITLYIILVLLLTGSCQESSYTSQLHRAEELMEEQPDSALKILNEVSLPKSVGETDRAYYALLLTQAYDKNYLIPQNDSLIRLAVAYYNQTEDVSMQARAYYQWGSVLRDINLQDEAVHKYLIAARYAESTEQWKLLGRIYGQTANLYYLQDLNEKADSIYQLVEQIAIRTKDTLLLSESLSKRGVIYREKGEEYYSVAENLMLKSWHLLHNSKNIIAKENIVSSLSRLYCHMRKGEKALHFAQMHYALQENKETCYWTYSLLGEAYFYLEEYDSAMYYLQKTLPISKYDTRAFVHMRLADILKIKGDYLQSLQHERLYSAYKDSVKNSRQSEAIALVEKNLFIEQLKEKHNNTHLIVCLVIALLIFIGVVLYLFFIRKGKTLENLHNKRHELLSAENKDLQNKNKALQQELHKRKRVEDIRLINAKITRIIEDYKQTDGSEEALNEHDWNLLIDYVNQTNNDVLERLHMEYKLKGDELYLCCLYLLKIPVLHCSYILDCSRDQIYKLGKRILEQKMGIVSKETTLKKEILKFIKSDRI